MHKAFREGFEKHADKAKLQDPYAAAAKAGVPWVAGGALAGLGAGALAKRPGVGAAIGAGVSLIPAAISGTKALSRTRVGNIIEEADAFAKTNPKPGHYRLQHDVPSKTQRYYGPSPVLLEVRD